MIPNDQRDHLRALLRTKMKRQERLQAMLDLLGADGFIALVLDMAEKHSIDRAIDRYRLPLLATKALLAGLPYIPPVVILCGARTRAGAPCKRKPIDGKRRCRNHGGLNTGKRTPQGRINAGKGLREWHAARRAAKASETR